MRSSADVPINIPTCHPLFESSHFRADYPRCRRFPRCLGCPCGRFEDLRLRGGPWIPIGFSAQTRLGLLDLPQKDRTPVGRFEGSPKSQTCRVWGWWRSENSLTMLDLQVSATRKASRVDASVGQWMRFKMALAPQEV